MATKKYRIIQVIADSSLSGGPRHVLDLLAGYKKTHPEFELHLICPSGWLPETAQDLAEVHVIDMPGNALNKTLQQNLRNALAELTGDRSIHTVVHFQGIRAGIAGAPAVRELELTAIYTEHRWTADYHLANPLREWAQLRALRRANSQMRATIAVSRAVADFLKARHLAPDKQIHLIANGVPIPPLSQTKQSVANGPKYVLGWIGSLIPVKSLNILIEALPLIRQNIPKVTIEVVGTGSDEISLKHLAKRLGVGDAVHFLGRVETIAFKRWDLFVSTSVTESFGMAIAEAMAAGLPVVATESAATGELVTPETGLLVSRHDHHELAKAIIDLLPQTQKRAAMGQAARERIKQHFALEQMVEKTADLYMTILYQ